MVFKVGTLFALSVQQVLRKSKTDGCFSAVVSVFAVLAPELVLVRIA